MTKARDARQDFVGRLGPHERPRALIREFDVAANGGFQLARAAMDTATELLPRERSKPALDEVDPRAAGRGEVDVKAWMPGQQRWISGVLCVLALSTMRWTSSLSSARPWTCGSCATASASATTACRSPSTPGCRHRPAAPGARPLPRRPDESAAGAPVFDRERLCALGPEVTAYVTVISQRRRRVFADELAAGLTLEPQLGGDGLRRAAAACVTRGTCGAEYLLLFAATEPALAVPDVPDQTAVDRDLAVYEAFVGR
jgi:hypothetical protein